MSSPANDPRARWERGIAELKDALATRRDDPRLREQLADLLVKLGRNDEAAGVLRALARDLARWGFDAQSIAVVKKLEAIAPGAEAEDHLLDALEQPAPPPPAAPAPEPVSSESFELMRMSAMP